MKLVEMTGEQVTTQFTTQQERLAASLNTVAMALHDASREMRTQDETTIADYVDTAANQVERFGGMLREQDVNQLIDATEQFARRRPALFLGVAFALGFAATRFLRSSSQSSAEMGSRDPGTSSYGSYGSGYGSAGTLSDLNYGESVDYGVDPPGQEDVPPGERPIRR
jgi:ElaB/YqjD/DUF883 family membrane-anchored ribosome-binding protein